MLQSIRPSIEAVIKLVAADITKKFSDHPAAKRRYSEPISNTNEALAKVIRPGAFIYKCKFMASCSDLYFQNVVFWISFLSIPCFLLISSLILERVSLSSFYTKEDYHNPTPYGGYFHPLPAPRRTFSNIVQVESLRFFVCDSTLITHIL